MKDFWKFLKKDTWSSWIVSIVLIIVFIKLIFFPSLSLLTGTNLPIVVVESCSMYHESSFDEWWDKNEAWYETKDVAKEDFEKFPSKNGLNKGDIIFVFGKKNYEIGDIIIFEPNSQSTTKHPLIHRMVGDSPIETKGDHNTRQLKIDNNAYKTDETNIPKENILGKSSIRIPLLGWIKLVFFEPFRPERDRGFCK